VLDAIFDQKNANAELGKKLIVSAIHVSRLFKIIQDLAKTESLLSMLSSFLRCYEALSSTTTVELPGPLAAVKISALTRARNQ
jgi:hypothetical protein